MDPRFNGYVFSGTLRPGIVSEQCVMPNDILKPDYAFTGISISEEKSRANPIEIKTPAQIVKMRNACRVNILR